MYTTKLDDDRIKVKIAYITSKITYNNIYNFYIYRIE